MRLRLITLLSASLALVPVASAEIPAVTAAIVSESRAVTPARFPNADVVVLESDQRVEVNAEGGYIRKTLTRTKAITEKGRRGMLSYSTGFNLSYGFAKVTGLRVIKADGRVVALDPEKQSAVQQDPSSMAANIYDPNDKILVVSIPGVELGDIVELAMEEGEPKPRMKGGFSDITPLESDRPVLRTRYTVVTPKTLPLARILVKDGDESGIRHTRTETSDAIEYEWTVDEAPQVIPEPMMPAAHLCVRRLLVSTIPDWKTISKWYYEISEPHFKITPEIREKAAELVKGLTDREARLRAVYKFVSQEIRYMGITTETEAPGYEPHDVSMTFGKRYGVCRDKAALLAVMLRAAGFDAYPVLILAGGNRMDEEVPTPYFNHAITAIREADGTYRLMDSTDENTKDIFPAYLSNCSYLVAHPEGTTLKVSPVPSAEANMLKADTRATVAADGTLTGVCHMDFGGINDTAYRGGLAQAKPDDIRRFVQQRLAGAVPGARVTEVKLEPENLLDTSRPMKLSVAFTVPEFLADRDGKAVLRAPFVARTFGFVAPQLAEAATLESRRFPLKLSFIAGIRESLSITLPETVTAPLAVPADKTLDDASLAYTRKLKVDGRTLTGELDLRLKRLDIPASDYAALREDLREISRAGRRVALFSTDSSVKPDSRVLSRKTVVTLADAHSARVRVEECRRILTYAGKKDNAELKLSWNTTNPEPVLERATVIDAAGVAHAVNPTEINVLDAEWVASAPRYAPSRIKVVALPNVEEGAEIRVAYSMTLRDLTAFSWREVFASTDAVDAEELEIVAPIGLELFLDNRAGAKVVREGDKVRVTVKRASLPAPREAGLAPARTWAPSLTLGTVRDESAYAAALNRTLSAKALPDDAVRRKASELTAGLADDARKVAALRDFVSKNIRHAGPAWGEVPAGELSGASRTLADGYGAEADRHLLFVALLRAAGYDATPALFCTNDLEVSLRREDEPLVAGFFDTLGARLRLKSGATVDFSELSQYADWRMNAGAGDLVLPLDTGVSGVVRSTPDSAETRYDIALDDAGRAEVRYADIRRGRNATAFNAWVSEITPEERDRTRQELLTGLSRDAKAAGELVMTKGVEGRMSFAAKVDDFAIIEGDYAYLDLPGGQGDVFGGAVDTSRRLPYALGSDRDLRTVWSVELPKGWKLAAEPVSVEWAGPSGIGRVSLRWHVAHLRDGGTRITGTKSLALRATVVTPEAYPALVELNRRMNSSDTWRLLLVRE